MTNKVNEPGGNKPLTPIQQPGDGPALVHQKHIVGTSSITRTDGAEVSQIIPQTPVVLKPEEGAELTLDQAKKLADDLKQWATINNLTVVIPGENLQALLNLAKSLNVSDVVYKNAGTLLSQRSLEQNAHSLESVLVTAIDENGKLKEGWVNLHNKYNKLLQKGDLNISDIPEGDKDQIFSLLTLYLLLSKLESSQRAMLFQGMQFEQINIQAAFVQKADIITKKAWTEIGFTALNVGLSGFTGMYGASLGGMYGKSTEGQAWSTFSKLSGEVIPSLGKATTSLTFEVYETDRARKQEQAQYNKSLQEDSMRQLREFISVVLDGRKQVIDSVSGVKSGIARNI